MDFHCNLLCLVRDQGRTKLFQFPCLEHFLRFHTVLTFIAFSFSCIISTARRVFKHYFFPVSLSNNKMGFTTVPILLKEYLVPVYFFIIYVYTNIFYKKLVLNSLLDYNRNIKNTIGYCFHNNTEQKKN